MVARRTTELCVHGSVKSIMSASPAFLVSLKPPTRGVGQTIWWNRLPKVVYGAGARSKKRMRASRNNLILRPAGPCSAPTSTAVALQAGTPTVAPSAEEVPDPDETDAKSSAAPANYR